MKTITLSNGVKMPVQGYGVLQLRDAGLCERWVTEALQAGNRLLDTAASYCNEEAVGNAIKKSGVPREDIFITTKLWIQDAKYENTIAAFEKSLKNLQTDYLDLYLIHQPFGDYYDAWRAMETLCQDGKIRAIGVSNFDEARLVDLCMNSRITPMVNQIELHPFHQQNRAIRSMQEWQVQPEAFSLKLTLLLLPCLILALESKIRYRAHLRPQSRLLVG